MGWNDRLDDPDAYEEYAESLRDQADIERKQRKQHILGSGDTLGMPEGAENYEEA